MESERNLENNNLEKGICVWLKNPLKNGAKILLKDAIDFHATGKSSSKSVLFFRIVFNPTFKNT